jgi:hypothetical protein
MATGRYALSDAQPIGAFSLADAQPAATFRTTNERDAAGDPVVRLKTESAAEGDQLLANMRNIRDWLGEKIDQWGQAGPHAVVEGLRQMQAGEYSKGLHQTAMGGLVTAAPMVAPQLLAAAIAAPVATAASVAGGVGLAAVAEPVGKEIGRFSGLSEDQAQLVGDVFAGAGGYRGAQLTPGQLVHVAETVLHPARAVGRTVGTVVDVAADTLAARRAARAPQQTAAAGPTVPGPVDPTAPHLDLTVPVQAGALTPEQLAERLRYGTGAPARMRDRAPVYAPRPTPTVVEPPAAPPAAPAPVVAAPAAAAPAAAPVVVAPAGPIAKPIMSPQMALNEVGQAARRAGVPMTLAEAQAVAELVQQGTTPQAAIRQWQVAIGQIPPAPVDPAAALAAQLGTPSDADVVAALDARWAKGHLKTPSAPTAGRMKAEADARLAAERAAAAPIEPVYTGGVHAEPVAAPPAPVDEGAIAARLHDEPAAPQSGGPVDSGGRRARPRRSPLERSTNADVLGDLVQEAVAGGHAGDPAALHRELTDRLQLIAEGDAAFDRESGHSPDVLLRAIAKLGGIGLEKETALTGEIRWLKEFRDVLPTKAGAGNLSMPRYRDSVRGVPGVFRDKRGLPLDDLVTRLRQDPRFAHIESPDDLIDEVRRAATTPRDDRIAADRLRASLGSNWWERLAPAVGDEAISFNPAELEAPVAAPAPNARTAVAAYDAARAEARAAEAVWQRAQAAYRRQTIDEQAYLDAQAAVMQARHAVVQADRAMRGKTGT